MTSTARCAWHLGQRSKKPRFKVINNLCTPLILMSVYIPVIARRVVAYSICVFASVTCVFAQQDIPLTIRAGVPLRLYITKRVSKRLNAPVDAKLLGPVFVFDHEVLPAGTQVIGHVSSLQPVSRWTRTSAMLNGDFTPLHVAQVQFTSLILPDGRHMALDTTATAGLKSISSFTRRNS